MMATQTDKLPPHSSEAEIGVIGCILLDPNEVIPACLERIKSSDVFYEVKQREVYELAVKMWESREPVEILSVQQKIKDSGRWGDDVASIVTYLSSAVDSVPSASNIRYYLDILVKKWTLRNLSRACVELSLAAHSPDVDVSTLVDQAERSILQVGEQHSRQGKSLIIEPVQAARRLLDDLSERLKNKGNITGIATGFHDLDKMTNGVQLGELAIIGARPSAGKTAIAADIVAHACLTNQVPTAFFTLEMRETAIMRRICACHAGVDAFTLRSGQFTNGDMPKIQAFASKAAKSPLYFVDGVSGITILQMASELRRLVKRYGVKLVVIDYLQKVKSAVAKEKRTYEVGEVSTLIKGLADSLGVAIISLAQLSREPDKDKGRFPRAADLADSAQIERDADLIGLLHRPRTQEDPQGLNAQLLVVKQRDGEVGSVSLNFNPKYCHFTSASKIQEP